jgi:hypothetical protein
MLGDAFCTFRVEPTWRRPATLPGQVYRLKDQQQK